MSTTPLRNAPSSSPSDGFSYSSQRAWGLRDGRHLAPTSLAGAPAGLSPLPRDRLDRSAHSSSRFRSLSPCLQFPSERQFHIRHEPFAKGVSCPDDVPSSPVPSTELPGNAGVSLRRKRDRAEISTTPTHDRQDPSDDPARPSWMLSALRRLPLVGSLVASSTRQPKTDVSPLESTEGSAEAQINRREASPTQPLSVHSNVSPSLTAQHQMLHNTTALSPLLNSYGCQKTRRAQFPHSGTPWNDAVWSHSEHPESSRRDAIRGHDSTPYEGSSLKTHFDEQRVLSELPVYANRTEEERDLAYILQMRRKYGLGPLDMNYGKEPTAAGTQRGSDSLATGPDDGPRGKRQRVSVPLLNQPPLPEGRDTLWDPFTTMTPMITHPADQRCSSQWQSEGTLPKNVPFSSPFLCNPHTAFRPSHSASTRLQTKRRGLRATDYRRLLRQAKFHPCHWIDYFDYVKAKDADKEDRRFFSKPLERRTRPQEDTPAKPRSGSTEAKLSNSEELTVREEPKRATTVLAVSDDVSGNTSRPVSLNAVDPKSFSTSPLKLSSTTVEAPPPPPPPTSEEQSTKTPEVLLEKSKEKLTTTLEVQQKATLTPVAPTAATEPPKPAATPWWKANLDKPVQVTVEGDGVFASNADDDEPSSKPSETTAETRKEVTSNDVNPPVAPPSSSLFTSSAPTFMFGSTSPCPDTARKPSEGPSSFSLKTAVPSFGGISGLSSSDSVPASLFASATTGVPAANNIATQSGTPSKPPSLSLFAPVTTPSTPNPPGQSGSVTASSMPLTQTNPRPSTELKETVAPIATDPVSMSPAVSSLSTMVPKDVPLASPTPALTSTVAPSSLFGNLGSSSLFAPSNTTGLNSMAAAPTTLPPTPNVPSPFGGLSSFQPSSGGGLFSSQPESAPPSLFGNTSGTGGGATATGGGLSSGSVQSNGMMSLSNTTAQSGATSVPFTFTTSLFGASAPSNPSPFGTSLSTGAPSLFGATNPPGKRPSVVPSLFGNDTTTATTSQPFVSTGSQEATPFSFGTTPPSQEAPSGSVLGAPTTNNPFAANVGAFAGSAARRPKIRLKRTIH